MSRHEVATAAVIVLIAAVAMVDSFKKAGWTPSGPDAGWYPFWSAAMMGVAAFIIFFLALRSKAARPLFNSAQGARAFWQLAFPMVIMVGLINWLGFYLVSAAYLALFARWLGRYQWIWVAILAISIPLALYLSFEQGFKVPLPKSLFYTQGIIPF